MRRASGRSRPSFPGFATKGGEPWLAFGVMGGDMQPQGQAQIIQNLVDYGLDMQAAGDAPRWHHEGSSEPTGEPAARRSARSHLETGVPDATQAGLAALGWQFGAVGRAASAAIRRSSAGPAAMRRPPKCARTGSPWPTDGESS